MVLGEGLGDWIYTVLATLDCLGLVRLAAGVVIAATRRARTDGSWNLCVDSQVYT